MNKNLKIGFFGTPEIAAYCLKKLIENFTVVFAITQEDKPQGRSKSPVKSPVKVAAEQVGIPVLQPAKIKDESFISSLQLYTADIFVIVAYGRIIPASIFNMPRLKTINLHPSLLPKYRGAAPVESSLRDGAKESGITVQYINERLDAGDIVCQTQFDIPEHYTAEDMYHMILPIGADLLVSAVNELSNGSIKIVPQNENDATYCGKFSKESAEINWNLSAISVHNQIRAFNPKPVAWTVFRSSTLRVWKSTIPADCELRPAPGEFAVYLKKRMIAGTSDGIIELLIVQPEGKKVMTADAFINGYKPAAGERFCR
jgi:methionyl-tRNA formyltransferase